MSASQRASDGPGRRVRLLGRPKKEIDPEELTRLIQSGLAMGKVASTLGIPKATLYRNECLKKGAENGTSQPLISQ